MSRCQGCGKRATRRTDDDVPVCADCYEALTLDGRVATLERQMAAVAHRASRPPFIDYGALPFRMGP